MTELPDHLKVRDGETREDWIARQYAENGSVLHCLRCGSVIAGPQFRAAHFEALHDSAFLEF